MAAIVMSKQALLPKICKRCCNICGVPSLSFCSASLPEEEDEFRKFEIMKKTERRRTFKSNAVKQEVRPPRYLNLPDNESWSNVWPTAQSFRPSVVPLPLHQGYVEKRAPPGKFANTELMKIPNFLHLTPPAIKLHCEAIKKFCTPWPKGLETDEDCEKKFPVEFISSDYCHAGPSIRDRRARIVTLKIKLSSLSLDYHARDKLLRLVGERYDPNTDILTIVNERCPLKQQNKEYAMYLLTALFYESWKFEPWEHEKTEADLEKFFWENSHSQETIINFISQIKENITQENKDSEKFAYVQKLPQHHTKDDIEKLKEVKEYAKSVTELINEGEDEATLQKYKRVTLNLLNVNPAFSDKEDSIVCT